VVTLSLFRQFWDCHQALGLCIVLMDSLRSQQGLIDFISSRKSLIIYAKIQKNRMHRFSPGVNVKEKKRFVP
jgi:hypothetical protein